MNYMNPLPPTTTHKRALETDASNTTLSQPSKNRKKVQDAAQSAVSVGLEATGVAPLQGRGGVNNNNTPTNNIALKRFKKPDQRPALISSSNSNKEFMTLKTLEEALNDLELEEADFFKPLIKNLTIDNFEIAAKKCEEIKNTLLTQALCKFALNDPFIFNLIVDTARNEVIAKNPYKFIGPASMRILQFLKNHAKEIKKFDFFFCYDQRELEFLSEFCKYCPEVEELSVIASNSSDLETEAVIIGEQMLFEEMANLNKLKKIQLENFISSEEDIQEYLKDQEIDNVEVTFINR